jgi:hypothetical protein
MTTTKRNDVEILASVDGAWPLQRLGRRTVEDRC